MAETAAEKETRLDAELVVARAAVARALTVGIMVQKGDRMRQNASLKELREVVSDLEVELDRLTRGGIPIRRAVPI